MKFRTALTHLVANLVLACVLMGGATTAFAQAAAPAPTPSKADAAAQLLQVPLHFEPNRGQIEEPTRFRSEGPGYALRLDGAGASLDLQGRGRRDTIRVTPAGGAMTIPVAERLMAGTVSDFGGRDERRWLRGLPTYERVRYPGVYPGIDLVFYGNQQRFEYDFVVAPGADPRKVRVAFGGADRLELAPSGDLLLHVGGVVLKQLKPVVYQDIDGTRREIAGRYRLLGAREITIDIGEYDTHHPLVIDPIFEWGYYLSDDLGGVAVNSKGEVIVARVRDGDAFVTRLSATGGFLSQMRIRGVGNPANAIAGVAVDYLDNIYVAGTTDGPDFPTTDNALIKDRPIVKILGFIPFPWMGGAKNGYITKLTPDGNDIYYSSFLGGDGDIGAFGAPCPGCSKVLKIVTAIKLRWFINPGDTSITSLAVRPRTQQVYLAGWTYSGAFPTTNTAVENSQVGTRFFTDTSAPIVAMIDTTKSNEASMAYGTYLSSHCAGEATAIAADANGEALVTGYTTATNFNAGEAILCGDIRPTDNTIRWSGRGWLARLSRPEAAQHGHYQYMTYLDEAGIAVAAGTGYGADVIQRDQHDNLTLTRIGYHDDGPLTIDSWQPWGSGRRASIQTIQRQGVGERFSQLIAHDDQGAAVVTLLTMDTGAREELYRIDNAQARGIAADRTNIYLAVSTLRTDLPALEAASGDGSDGYVTRIAHDLDTSDNGPNILYIDASWDIERTADGPYGAFVNFPEAKGTYWFDGTERQGSCTPTYGVFPIGETVVRCQVDMTGIRPGVSVINGDVNGNVDTFVVRITEPPPQMVVPENYVVEPASAAGRVVSWPDYQVRAWDMYGSLPAACTPASGSTFPIGTTTVTCRSLSSEGSVVRIEKSFTVTVRDSVAPRIDASFDLAPGVARSSIVVASAGPSGASYTFSASAQDGIDGTLAVTCVWPLGSSSTYPVTAAFALGQSALICSTHDNSGNVTTRNIKVVVEGDARAPVLSLHVSGEAEPRPLELPSYSGENRPPLQLSHLVYAERPVDGDAVAYFSRSLGACDAWRAQYQVAEPDRLAPACVAIVANDAFDGARPVTCETSVNGQVAQVLLSDVPQALHFGDVPTFSGANVSCTALDSGSRQGTLPLTFQMQDSRAPIFSNVPSDVFTAADDSGYARVFWETPVAFWPAIGGPLEVKCVWPAGTDFPVGDSLVRCYAGAPSGVGDLGWVGFTVHVSEALPPLPQVNITSGPGTASSSRSAVFTFAPFGSAVTPAGVTLVCSLDHGEFEPCQSPIGYVGLADGPHMFEVKARRHGEDGEANAWLWSVSVTEHVLGSMTVPESLVLEATGPGGAVATFAVAPVDGDPVACAPASGTTFPLGTNIVNCAAGLAGRQVKGTFTVTVLDTTPPALDLLPDQRVDAYDESGIAIYFNATHYDEPCWDLFGDRLVCGLAMGVDLVDGPVAVTCPGLRDQVFPIGVTTSSCFATDTHGNIAQDSFTITVAGPSTLSIVPPAAVSAEATSAAGAFIGNVTLGQPSITGARGLVTLSRAPAGNQFPIGETTVTWMAADAAGFTVMAEQRVVVHATVAPPVNPIPLIDHLEPNSVVKRDPALDASDFVLHIHGAGFVQQSVVRWNGVQVGKTFLGTDHLVVTVPAATLSETGVRYITVFNPVTGGGGGSSAIKELFITDSPTAVLAATTATSSGGALTVSAGVTPDSVAVQTVGAGPATVTVARYAGNPGGAVTFAGAGSFFDIFVGPWTGSAIATLTGTICAPGATRVYWFYGSTWQLASAQSYDAIAGCVVVTVTDETSPTLDELDGTYFATAGDVTGPTLPPAITVPGDVIAEATWGTGSVVTFEASAIDPVDGATPVTCAPASGSLFPIGLTVVSCSATNQAGLTASLAFPITVHDSVAPVVSVPASMTMAATSASGAVATFSASASDLVDGNVAVSCAPASGSTFPVGATTVSCSATDAHGNADAAGFTVTVTPYVTPKPPTISVRNTTVEATGPEGAVVTLKATANDKIDGPLIPVCAPASGSMFPVGQTNVTCTATNSTGASVSASAVVTVRDTKGPKVDKLPNQKVEATGPAGAIATYVASATDLVDGSVPVTCAPASGSLFPLGKTTVTCSAADHSGNAGTDTFIVNVVDTTDPAIVSVTPSVTVLPNTNEVVPVSIAALATDLVDAAPVCQIIRVAGGGQDLNSDGVIDWTITGPLTLNVEAVARARRDRTYTITVKCTDASGNASKEKTAVVVSRQ